MRTAGRIYIAACLVSIGAVYMICGIEGMRAWAKGRK